MANNDNQRVTKNNWVVLGGASEKCILGTMYVRKKHNRSGSTSVVVVSKVSGKYREIKSGSSEIWSGA